MVLKGFEMVPHLALIFLESLFFTIREGLPTIFFFSNGHCPDRSYSPPPRGPFFWPSKTTFMRVLQNQIPIENDDENGENFDA